MIEILVALSLAMSPLATAQEGSSEGRVRTIAYSENQVVPIRAASNYQVTLLFTGESIANVAIGDADSWEATLNGQGDALFLKPLRSGGTTNMTVITNARHYAFELSAGPMLAPDTPYTIRFAPGGATGAESPSPGIGRYRVSGARALRPVSIDDDGQRTFIVWPPAQALPAVFAQDGEGTRTLLEGHMRNGRYVIDGVHPTLVFQVERQTARAERQRPRP